MKTPYHCVIGLLGLAIAGLALAGPTTAPTTAPTTQPYPLNECVVSGESFGKMGDPFTLTHDGREVRLCCEACAADFKADPVLYMKKINDALAKIGATTQPSHQHHH